MDKRLCVYTDKTIFGFTDIDDCCVYLFHYNVVFDIVILSLMNLAL